jgi:DNA-binding response OmpR family regulator
MAILALEKDLFFAVRIRDTLRHHNREVTIVRTLPAFEAALSSPEETRPQLAIVNIATKGVDWEAAIRTARANNIPVLAFGSHMDLDARARALEAGADKVVANSKFVSNMLELVQGMLNGTSSS